MSVFFNSVKVIVFFHYKTVIRRKKDQPPTIQCVFNVGAISRRGVHFVVVCFSKIILKIQIGFVLVLF